MTPRNFLLLPLLIFSVSQSHGQDVSYEEVEDLAFQVLSAAQETSIRRNRELCGYIGTAPDGSLRATEPTIGQPSECYAADPPADWFLLASYHTHGAFSVDAASETPSTTDIIADREEGVVGFLGTPGGRFWYIDGPGEAAEIICDRCMPVDPSFQELEEVADTYTLQELERLE